MVEFKVTLWAVSENDSVVTAIVLPFAPSVGLFLKNKFADEATVKITRCSYDVDSKEFDCDVEFVSPFDDEDQMELDMQDLTPYGWNRPTS